MFSIRICKKSLAAQTNPTQLTLTRDLESWIHCFGAFYQWNNSRLQLIDHLQCFIVVDSITNTNSLLLSGSISLWALLREDVCRWLPPNKVLRALNLFRCVWLAETFWPLWTGQGQMKDHNPQENELLPRKHKRSRTSLNVESCSSATCSGTHSNVTAIIAWSYESHSQQSDQWKTNPLHLTWLQNHSFVSASQTHSQHAIQIVWEALLREAHLT